MALSAIARRVMFAVTLMLCLILPEASSIAQKGGGQNPAASQTAAPSAGAASPTSPASSAPSSPALQGISFSRDSWNEISALPSPKTFGLGRDDVSSFLDDLQGHSFRKDVLVYCYTLTRNLTAGAPFIFEPTPAPVPVSKYELCTNQTQTEHRGVSLIMGRYLVFRIDISGIPAEMRNRIQTLNLNVTSAAGTPFNSQRGSSLNPSLARPRMALLSGQPFPCNEDLHDFYPYQLNGESLRNAFCPAGGNPLVENPTVVYLVWPGPLVADTVATISANLIYTPVAPALPWRPDTFYPAGSVVISSAGGHTNGHYYQALTGGTSPRAAEPDFNEGLVNVREYPDGGDGLTWLKMGSVCQQSAPAPGAPTQTPAIAGITLYSPGTTTYATGQFVYLPVPGNCHFYRAIVTGGTPPPIAKGNPAIFPTSGGKPFPDKAGAKGSLSWQDMGPISVPTWAAGTAYPVGAFVTPSPTNGYFYMATVLGVSGAFQPAFPVDGVEPMVHDSWGLVWLDAGAGATPPSSIKVLKEWAASTPYILGDGVLDRASGHYYVAIQPGVSGGEEPLFAVPAPQVIADTVPQWQDIGTAPPASALLGTQPADQTVSLINLTLPQVHSLTWFNVASGVVVSSLRPTAVTTYTGVGPSQSTSAPPDVCPTGVSTCTLYTTSKGSHLVDPVLGLTFYALHPLDVEQRFRMQDFIPAPVFNLSLLSPTTNFHIGFSSEFFIRNLQLVYGASLVQETRLPAGKPTTTVGNQPAYLTTVKKFNKGAYFGFTVNITGLINAATGLIP